MAKNVFFYEFFMRRCSTVKSVGQYEKRENHKIFELQKKTIRIACGNARGSLREKNGFVKTYPQFSP
ncbi:MAG: hypothetical protein ACI9XO_003917 [Paraglaciecola sp.]|jgi:hypothetical protein